MAISKRHLVRRTILSALGSFEAPRDFESILLDPGWFAIFGCFDLSRDEAAMVAEEWQALTDLGYLEAIPRYPECRKLSEIGREFAQNPAKMAASPCFGGLPQ